MSSVFIINGGAAYRKMFIDNGWECTSDFWKADLVQFTGGADVTPAIYGEKNTNSGNDEARDFREAGYFALARRMNKPMAGICRGGQFLNVMCGGYMIQHVNGHAIHGTHPIVKHNEFGFVTKDKVNVTSTHHQLMMPGDHAIVLASANIVTEMDSEVVYYEDEECLCFQPHPEFPGYEECTRYYFQLIHEYLGF